MNAKLNLWPDRKRSELPTLITAWPALGAINPHSSVSGLKTVGSNSHRTAESDYRYPCAYYDLAHRLP